MKEKLQKHADKFRFGLVGLFNTGLDFAVLFLLTNLGLDRTVANYISTTIAFIVSFGLNRSFTFRSEADSKKQILPFLVVTLSGLWILQPIIIHFGPTILGDLGNQELRLFICKVLATGVTMVWNYALYKHFVFKTA